ncbi:MAG TPA: hypothetical protein VNA26_06280 [Chitinophagaceae bacterium]|nr:hypothetical protein [Chitinophagaceae bacterium]
MRNTIFFLSAIILLTACKNSTGSSQASAPDQCLTLKAKAEIENVIREGRDCNQRKDIDCFMDSFDSSFVLESNDSADKGRTISKDTIRKDILRSWSIISKMYEVEQWIDSFTLLSPDTAIVFTDQFYHRTFTKPNNLPGEDDVVSTQKHREVWIRRDKGWRQARVKELGGAIYVNGKPYNPQQK